MTVVDHDHQAALRDLPARWTGAQLRSMTERTLHDLLLDVQAEQGRARPGPTRADQESSRQ